MNMKGNHKEKAKELFQKVQKMTYDSSLSTKENYNRTRDLCVCMINQTNEQRNKDLGEYSEYWTLVMQEINSYDPDTK